MTQDGSGDIDRAEVMLLLQDLGLQVRLQSHSQRDNDVCYVELTNLDRIECFFAVCTIAAYRRIGSLALYARVD